MIKENEQVMYMGPAIRGIVKNGAVFTAGIPKKLEKLAEKKPIIRKLIIPLSEIVQAKKDLDTEGSVTSAAYDRILSLSETEIREITEVE